MSLESNIQQYVGKISEKDIAKLCKSNGWWVHKMPTTTNGQSVDFIIVRKETFLIFDSKHVSADKISFTFGRVESNQQISMQYMVEFAHINPARIGFAIYFERLNKWLWLDYTTYQKLIAMGLKSVNANEIINNDFLEIIK